MKNYKLLSMCAGVTGLMTAAANAGHTSAPEVDSTLQPQLTIVTDGGETVNNGVVRSRTNTSRVGSRELLELIQIYAGEIFPRGSKLIATNDGETLVVDRSGNEIYDASELIGVTFNRNEQVESGTFRVSSGNSNSLYRFIMTLRLSFEGSLVVSVSDAEVSEGIISTLPTLSSDSDNPLKGAASERETVNYNRFRDETRVSSSVSGRVAGIVDSDDETGVTEGTVRLSGRDSFEGPPEDDE